MWRIKSSRLSVFITAVVDEHLTGDFISTDAVRVKYSLKTFVEFLVTPNHHLRHKYKLQN